MAGVKLRPHKIHLQLELVDAIKDAGNIKVELENNVENFEICTVVSTMNRLTFLDDTFEIIVVVVVVVVVAILVDVVVADVVAVYKICGLKINDW
ncbi:hypothetical protein Tco_1033012 [Tanacetum coccineum]|uniref:Uncharacterized protein n=1 Tax=Tanacetum coccineum TaxID=301880 RepID=A0ABQ5GDJ4_9ASTR